MQTVTVHEAKTHLSRLINRVLEGEEITVTRGKEPVIKLVPVEARIRKRQLGWLAHMVTPGNDPLADGFWDPLPADELALWNGESLADDPAR